MRRRFHPVEWLFLLAPAITAALIATVGCANLKAIPIFNPDAKLKNRIASAYEVLTETNGQVADAVTNGWITQEEVNRNWAPSLDDAHKAIDAADAMRVAGDTTGAGQKLDSVKATLQTIRGALERMRKART